MIELFITRFPPAEPYAGRTARPSKSCASSGTWASEHVFDPLAAVFFLWLFAATLC